jgi:hypothetical protein
MFVFFIYTLYGVATSFSQKKYLIIYQIINIFYSMIKEFYNINITTLLTKLILQFYQK